MHYKEAMFYNQLKDDKVQCFLCPHNCVIEKGKTGICNVRNNYDGKLYTINYRKITSAALDPIEKKPLNRFFSGSYIFSIGTFGCNLKCFHCQNYTIAHDMPEAKEVDSDTIIQTAKKYNNCIGIAYTYNEPSIWYEYVYECAKKAHTEDLKNVMVTNGYIGKGPLEQILPYIDAMNIDVKGYNDSFYKKQCGGRLTPVKKTVEIASKSCHVEITTLIIPGLNDNINDMRDLCKWILTIDGNITLHITRFFPMYKMQNTQITPLETLKKLYDEAKKYLKHVYLGNV